MPLSPTTRLPRQKRRRQLLELATEVFSRKGFQATSMDDIAAAAGVTKPVLYQHFTSKESLYAEVLDIIAETMIAEVRAIGQVQGDTSERVRTGLERFYRFVALENSLRLFTGHEWVSEQVHQRVDAVLDHMALELAGVLTSFREMGAEESRVLGRGIITLAQTTAQLLHDAADEEERDLVLETMTTAVVHGLTGFSPR